jgi:glycosyltransferase involved in cell wall biosynthesis
MVLRPDEGGAFRHVADLSSGLIDRGHEVLVCGPLEHRATELRAPVVPLAMSRDISPRHDLRSLVGLAGVIHRTRPDVVHAHGTKGGVFARAGHPFRPGLPVLYTPHGYPFNGFFTSEAARRRYRLIERSLSPLATRTVCVCEAERRLACEVGPCSRTRVVHNGTLPAADVTPRADVDELRSEGGTVVGVLAGLRPGKGLETMVEAWAGLAPEHPRSTLVIAGDGPERPRLEATMRNLGVADSIRLLGHTTDVDSFLASLDVFVNPSWAESFPYAVLEAMSRGLPIVATDVGGVGEAVRDGETGRLVPAKDAGRLASAVAEVLSSPQERGRLGAAARELHRRSFSLDAMVEGNLRVYEEVASGKERPNARPVEN